MPDRPGSAPPSAGDGAREAIERLRGALAERAAEPAAPAAPAVFAIAAPPAPPGAPAASEAPAPSFPVTVPVPDPRFGEALGERVTWLVREGLQSAELTLNPLELGPIRIELRLDGDAATIGFSALQAETRGAIEQALPKLRELLSQQGLQLGGAQIDAGGQRGQDGGARARAGRIERASALAGVGGAAAEPAAMPRAAPRATTGRLDLFA
ncbi:MAG TPA: flagellar hook-length control protein FliK [Burkholderiaceae bacterium]|nr:flagellar hook-length control protein FliK [Burkholderiaceae bacterium]